MKSLPDPELKKLATRSGPKQHLAFDELARRIRDNSSSWSPEEGPWAWNRIDITRAPNAIEAEWAFLKWSQQLNGGKNPDLEQKQAARLDELESHLGQDPDSLETKYFNAIGDELRKEKCEFSRLERITLKGFKTIHALIDFEPHSRTVLIGPNGAGKSNFISFFRLMSWALAGPDQLALHVSQQGGSRRLLHDGPAHTREIEAELTIRTAAGENDYTFRLFHAAGDTLVFADERYRFSRVGSPSKAPWKALGAGHKDPQLRTATMEDQTAQVIRALLQKIVVYQFHNTSDTARIRGKHPVYDNRWLKEDAANLAPVLYRLQTRDRRYYQRIVDTIRLVLPLFSDFELEPDSGHLMLAWRERDTDEVFNASQASDGLLRIIALITLLLQPAHNLPDVLILDEPELGLHPSAINVIGGLIAAAATKIQVIAATQSVALVDCFDPEDIVVVERPDRASTFKRLDPATLKEWLEEYSLSELWEKNVIGGRP